MKRHQPGGYLHGGLRWRERFSARTRGNDGSSAQTHASRPPRFHRQFHGYDHRPAAFRIDDFSRHGDERTQANFQILHRYLRITMLRHRAENMRGSIIGMCHRELQPGIRRKFPEGKTAICARHDQPKSKSGRAGNGDIRSFHRPPGDGIQRTAGDRNSRMQDGDRVCHRSALLLQSVCENNFAGQFAVRAGSEHRQRNLQIGRPIDAVVLDSAKLETSVLSADRSQFRSYLRIHLTQPQR